jgi:hypothetical protein
MVHPHLARRAPRTFRHTIELVPKPKAELVQAVDLAMAGDWEAAHRIVQEREDDSAANWIHAVVHRMEGDRENARYWYQRCGRAFPEDLSTTAELEEIRAALAP